MAGKVNIWTYNVVCGVILTFLSCFGSGMYQQTVMPAFLLYVGGDNTAVGFAEGLMGIAQMVIAFPVSWHADKYRRSTSIRFGALLTFIQAGILVCAVRMAEPGSTSSYSLLCVALVIGGVCNGILGGPLMALIDDSVPAGSRSEVNTVTMIAVNLGTAGGPMLAAAFFAKTGNTWSIDSMKTVIVAGVLFAQTSNVFAMTMDDSKALQEDSEAVHLQENLLDTKEGDDGRKGGNSSKKTCFGFIGPASIPYLMFAGTLMFCMGAGMTIRFFPIFFQKECQMPPSVVNMVYASLGLVMACANILAQRISKKIGRLEVIIPSLIIGVGCTGLMGALKPFYTVKWVMIPLFIGRMAFMNGVNAIQYSITADYTPKSQRARFMALQSIAGFSWSGSAFVGGWLIDQYGYGPCFVITSIFQGCAIPFFFLMYAHVATESDLTDAIEARKAAEEKASGLRTAMMTPPGMIRTPSERRKMPSASAE